jgi:hypothetical protein
LRVSTSVILLSEILVPDKFWPHLLMSNQYSMEQ